MDSINLDSFVFICTENTENMKQSVEPDRTWYTKNKISNHLQFLGNFPRFISILLVGICSLLQSAKAIESTFRDAWCLGPLAAGCQHTKTVEVAFALTPGSKKDWGASSAVVDLRDSSCDSSTSRHPLSFTTTQYSSMPS